MAPGRCALETPSPLQCEAPPASGAPASRPACRPRSSSGRRARRVPSGQDRAPRVQGHRGADGSGTEPGPGRSRSTSPRSRHSSSWSRGLERRVPPGEPAGVRAERLQAPSAGAGCGAAAGPAIGEGWRRPGTPDPRGGGARSRAPGASPARPGPGHLLRSQRARDVSALLAHPLPSSPTPSLPLFPPPLLPPPSPGPAPASPGAPRTRTLGLRGDPGGGVCWESPNSSRPAPLPPPGPSQRRCRNGF